MSKYNLILKREGQLTNSIISGAMPMHMTITRKVVIYALLIFIMEDLKELLTPMENGKL